MPNRVACFGPVGAAQFNKLPTTIGETAGAREKKR